MKVAVFDTHGFEEKYFEEANQKFGHELRFFESRLSDETVSLAFGFPAISVFVNDCVNAEILNALHVGQVKLIAIRATGFNNVDLEVAQKLGIRVVRVPEYSPHAVAEYTLGLILCLNRKIHRAHQRVREGNFSLEGLVGFDLYGKTVGVIGTGRIGSIVVKILSAMGCQVLANDIQPSEDVANLPGVKYVELEEIYKNCDIISLHVPLTPQTHHIIDESAFLKMKPEVMLINTGRGALIDTRSLIKALKCGEISYAGLDVYEEDDKVFFRDLSDQVLKDDLIARLMTFSNVLITAHQGFLTREALRNIANTTLQNISDFEQGKSLINELCSEDVIKKAA